MKPPETRKTIHMIQAVEFVIDVLIAIAVPTTLFAIGGRWLDRRYDASPLFVIAGFIIAMAVTFVMVKKQVERYKKLTQ